jgi:predicted dinucleotide-binding enzyme
VFRLPRAANRRRARVRDDAGAEGQVMDLVVAVCGHAGVDAGPLSLPDSSSR